MPRTAMVAPPGPGAGAGAGRGATAAWAVPANTTTANAIASRYMTRRIASPFQPWLGMTQTAAASVSPALTITL